MFNLKFIAIHKSRGEVKIIGKLFVMFFYFPTWSAETARTTSSSTSTIQAQASMPKPKCFSETKTLRQSKHPEADIKKLFKNLTDEEVQTRLVFAEALATGSDCMAGKEKEALIKGIAWVIANRVKDPQARFGNGREAVFRKQQFRSSFGSCDVAHRKALLCPTSLGKDWGTMWTSAQVAVQKAHHGDNNPMPEVQHYFFPKHFENSNNCKRWQGQSPNWANKNKRVDPDILGLETNSSCIEFYKLL